MSDFNRFLYIFFFQIVVATGYSQPFVRKVVVGANQRIDISGAITALAFQSQEYLGESVKVKINGQDILLPLDPDAPTYTYFASIIPQKIQSFDMKETGILSLINSGKTPTIALNLRSNQDDCNYEPNPIGQSVWRDGLPTPSFSRSFTDVAHVIVHHSAGSNTSTNYTQTVRDIYLYHTQTNGWSDIGYNYLIAQNGDLYAGRDPDGGAQDNVLGAHFCGKNSNTMGICLLGNYETIQPTDPIWSTLQWVLTWKMKKEALSPQGFEPHPLGNIAHIAGHRDGCSTLCPGQNVYRQLDDLRQSVADKLRSCEAKLSFQSSNATIESGESITFTNTSSGYEQYSWYFEGGFPESIERQPIETVTYPNPGIYDVAIIGTKEETMDTAYYENIVLVKGELKMFPNPVAPNAILTLAEDAIISEIEITDTKGALCFAKKLNGNTKVELPNLNVGLYIMRIHVNGLWTAQRLIVE